MLFCTLPSPCPFGRVISKMEETVCHGCRHHITGFDHAFYGPSTPPSAWVWAQRGFRLTSHLRVYFHCEIRTASQIKQSNCIAMVRHPPTSHDRQWKWLYFQWRVKVNSSLKIESLSLSIIGSWRISDHPCFGDTKVLCVHCTALVLWNYTKVTVAGVQGLRLMVL